MSPLRIVYLIVLAVCALGSGFFSGSETALISIGKERVLQLGDQGRRGKRVQDLVADPDRLLSTLLVANNLVNILGASVATSLFIELIGEQWGPWVATGAVTAVVLVVGEITPKSLAARYPERFSLAVAPTIWQLSRILGPVARLFSAITRGMFRLFRLPVDSRVAAVTEEDIRALAQLGHQEGEIHEWEREIIEALFTLADRPVRDVMTPRMDIATLEIPFRIEDVQRLVSETGHSRYVVTEGDLDHMLGVLFVKDLLQLPGNPSPEEIRRLLRVPNYIPESASILSVLQQMRTRRFAFGVVLDEHGGVEGVVTIKDLVAELVGELQDEYDPGAPTMVRIGTSEWLADGRIALEDMADGLETDLPDGPYSTAGGLVMAVAGKIPAEGDLVEVGDFVFTVLQMDRNRIDRLRIERRA